MPWHPPRPPKQPSVQQPENRSEERHSLPGEEWQELVKLWQNKFTQLEQLSKQQHAALLTSLQHQHAQLLSLQRQVCQMSGVVEDSSTEVKRLSSDLRAGGERPYPNTMHGKGKGLDNERLSWDGKGEGKGKDGKGGTDVFAWGQGKGVGRGRRPDPTSFSSSSCIVHMSRQDLVQVPEGRVGAERSSLPARSGFDFGPVCRPPGSAAPPVAEDL